MFIFVAFIGISILIVMHELGHYAVARACGMRVIKFSVGFGPALFRRKIGGTLFQFAAIPFGGYVQIEGLGPQEPQPAHTGPNHETVVLADPEPPHSLLNTLEGDTFGFRDKPVWQRILVIAAGPAANWVLAVAMIALAAATVGSSAGNTTTVAEVVPGSAAESAGLRVGDTILKIDNDVIQTWDSLVEHIQQNAGIQITVSLERQGEQLDILATPRDVEGVGMLGIAPTQKMVRLGLGRAVGFGFERTVSLSGLILTDLGNILSPKTKLTGPVGIIGGVAKSAQRGLATFLGILAYISVALALFNLLPVPALDGGRLVFLFAETIRGKPVDEKIEGIIHAVGFILLIGTVLVVTFKNDLGVFSNDDSDVSAVHEAADFPSEDEPLPAPKNTGDATPEAHELKMGTPDDVKDEAIEEQTSPPLSPSESSP